VVVAMYHLEMVCKKLKYDKQIILLTDAETAVNTDGVEDIKAKLLDMDISVIVV
jgi:hypothetical protein